MPLYITKKDQCKTIKMLIIDDSFDDTLKLENAIMEATKASSYSIIIHTRNNADELLTIAKEYDYIFLDIVFQSFKFLKFLCYFPFLYFLLKARFS